MKCKAWCCENTNEDTSFEGEFCYHCYQLITTGEGKTGTSFIFQLRTRYTEIKSKLDTISDIINCNKIKPK